MKSIPAHILDGFLSKLKSLVPIDEFLLIVYSYHKFIIDLFNRSIYKVIISNERVCERNPLNLIRLNSTFDNVLLTCESCAAFWSLV